eukprot:CAMPEP_0202892372 /NCGR_PEP_ID=MMETSP1392-20130828/2091_1 /ASSEMBLY_ACC=CAM_ASM_000868 /TAXON_ID=225041 /ORGANISM="Chlamydomonas chlamydogama, Strain SAG 11-48b" /LENGTH=43 /DNA_ID= /DNA_START= /DNA_END= /DNA_ORIENTATION=
MSGSMSGSTGNTRVMSFPPGLMRRAQDAAQSARMLGCNAQPNV